MGKGGKNKANRPLLDIQDAINCTMHRQRTSHTFICKHDLDQVWAEYSPNDLFPNLTRDEQRLIRRNFLRVLSILIYAGWTDLSRFRPLFLREDGRDDTHLPFEDLSFLENFGPIFSFHQHAFTPVIIEEHNGRYIQGVSPELRLPFTEEPEPIGKGGYGSVTKRVIAPRCLWNKQENRDNPEPKPVACKSYKSQTPVQDFKREVDNLDFIKESLIDCKRVMKHIAAIVHGNEFMIVSPLANLRDLEIFLRGGHEPNPGTDALEQVYDFNLKFPLLDTPAKLKQAVVKEATQLASALKWLHEDLFGSSDRYLAHMDLKPANILLVEDPRSPAGKWMLSDFGVSSFKKETNARAPDTPSIHDIGLRLTSRGDQDRISRGHGPYQPPEVNLENVDGRKCDVWSFSCVLCDILAFAIGKTEDVYRLRNARYDGKDDFFYKKTEPTEKRLKKIDNSNTMLKSQIVEWWERLEYSSASWVVDYINILRKALKPKPSERPDIREIANSLRELAPLILSDVNGTLTPESELPLSESQTNGLTTEEGRPSITLSPASIPLRREIMYLEEAAPIGDDQAQSSTNFLSPRNALHQGQRLPAEHDEVSSQSSSSTEGLSDGAVHADAAEVTLVTAERGSQSPLDERSSEGDSASASIVAFQARTQMEISLPKKARVKAVAVSPSPLHVAVLCKRSVHLYSVTDGGETKRDVELSPKVNWKKIRLNSNTYAIYGLGLSNEKQIEIFDWKTLSPEATVTDTTQAVQDILLSDEKVFAYVYGRSLKVYFARSKNSSVVKFTEDDANIIQAKFSASGKIICIWATGTRADHAYFVRVNEEQASASLCSEGSYQKTITNPRTCDIWPYLDSPACFINDAHGGTFLAQSLKQPQSEPHQRNSIEISSVLTACLIREDLLVCLKSKILRSERLLCGFILSQGPKGQRRIAGRQRDFCAAHKDIDKSTATAVHLVNGKCELVLCTTTGKVLRYVQS